MGGDDLGSDDEYLQVSGYEKSPGTFIGDDSSDGDSDDSSNSNNVNDSNDVIDSAISSSDDDFDKNDERTDTRTSTSSKFAEQIEPNKKRKTNQSLQLRDQQNVYDAPGANDEQLASKKKQQKCTHETNGVIRGSNDGGGGSGGGGSRKDKTEEKVNSKNILIHAGRGIASDGPDAQAVFLGTCYSHAIKLSSSHNVSIEGDGEDFADFSFEPDHFYVSDMKQNHSNLAAFLKAGPLSLTNTEKSEAKSKGGNGGKCGKDFTLAMKHLKNWKHPHSPMILIVTLSARRSVELLKQLSSLKLPVAKLFAKHMSVDDQVKLLGGGVGRGKGSDKGNKGEKFGGAGGKGKKGVNERYYGIGVGTPGRFLTLLRHGREGGSDGALNLNHTGLVIIDCHQDSKGFTVCTLNDTSREVMEFLREGVVPQLDRRAGKIKMAMF